MAKFFSRILLASAFLMSLVFAARVETKQIPSKAMDKDIPALIVLPDSYAESAVAYPVLYLLHGYDGDYSNWDKKTDMRSLADQYGMIIVCPDGSKNSWYLDDPIDQKSQYETHVALEVPRFIDAHYRTIKSREGRAITGLSMGGHGALLLAFRHWEIFGAAGSMSGGLDLRPFSDRWSIAEKLGSISVYPERWEENSVINNIGKFPPGKLRIIIDCGVDDFFIGVNRAMHKKLLDAKIPHDYSERPGGHSWTYWGNSIKYQVLFFYEYFKNNSLNNE